MQSNPSLNSVVWYMGGLNFLDCKSSCNSVLESLNSSLIVIWDNSFLNRPWINLSAESHPLSRNTAPIIDSIVPSKIECFLLSDKFDVPFERLINLITLSLTVSYTHLRAHET